jgi:hypothetical protein
MPVLIVIAPFSMGFISHVDSFDLQLAGFPEIPPFTGLQATRVPTLLFGDAIWIVIEIRPVGRSARCKKTENQEPNGFLSNQKFSMKKAPRAFPRVA